MRRGIARHHSEGHALFRVAVVLLTLAIVAGCVAAPRTTQPTPTTTAQPAPTSAAQPTSAATAQPTATARPAPITPTRTRTPSATATPIPPPSTACVPAPGIQPVSSTVIRTGNTSKRQVSLTFDSDGGGAGTAIQYLNILRARNVHATFFLTGLFARAHPDIVRRILAEGHELGNHTLDHADLVKTPRSDTFVCTELTQAERLIVTAGGHTSRPFFRPPNGSYNDQVRSLAARLGYRTVYWSIDPRDWERTATAQEIISRVLDSRALKPGAIILMHISSPNEQYALDSIIAELHQRGYAIVPLSQLLR